MRFTSVQCRVILKMEGLQDSNSVHFYPETRLKSVESSKSNPVGPSCSTTMQSRPDSCNNGQGHRINFVKWPITTMPPLARACSLLTFSPRCRSGAAPMPISHLSGRARYTINLEVSALCLKRLWAKIVVKCRSFQPLSFRQSSARF